MKTENSACYKHQIDELFKTTIVVDGKINIRRPEKEDAEFLKKLWGNPEVMKCVGFPQGMKVSDEKVTSWIEDWQKSGRLRMIIEDTEKKYRSEKLATGKMKVSHLHIKKQF